MAKDLLNGNSDDLKKIKEKVNKYQNDFAAKVKKGELKDYTLPKAYAYTKEDIESVLGQSGCTGIRVYFSEAAEKTINLVIVGTDKDGNNILPTESTESTLKAAQQEAAIIDTGSPCPQICPANPL